MQSKQNWGNDAKFLEVYLKLLCMTRDLEEDRYQNTARHVKKAYSARKTVVSSNSTFLFGPLNLGMSLGRFREVSLRVGVGPILKSEVLFPPEINTKFH